MTPRINYFRAPTPAIFHRPARAFLIFAFLIFSFAFVSRATPPAGYYLVWSDEFSGSSLDASKWGYRSGGYHDAVNTSSTISVSGGASHHHDLHRQRHALHGDFGVAE